VSELAPYLLTGSAPVVLLLGLLYLLYTFHGPKANVTDFEFNVERHNFAGPEREVRPLVHFEPPLQVKKSGKPESHVFRPSLSSVGSVQ
jgi:hypothetical protein